MFKFKWSCVSDQVVNKATEAKLRSVNTSKENPTHFHHTCFFFIQELTLAKDKVATNVNKLFMLK